MAAEPRQESSYHRLVLSKSGRTRELQVPGVVKADQGWGPVGIPLHDGDGAVGLVEADPAPQSGIEHVADEPADHEVVRDQQFVPVVVACDAEVPDGGLQGCRVLVTLVIRYAIEPGMPAARVAVTLSGGRYRRPVRYQVAGMSRHLREIAGDDIGRLRRPRQRTVVDCRERDLAQPSAEPVCLLATDLR